MIEIERQTRKSKTIPLISLIDVVFQLLIYFMLTTSFTRSESLELSLPATAETAAMAKHNENQTIHIYISATGETFLENKSMGEEDMSHALRTLVSQNPDCGVLVLSAAEVPVKVLVRVMDRIYTAGGKNIAVADWIIPQQQSKPKDENAHG